MKWLQIGGGVAILTWMVLVVVQLHGISSRLDKFRKIWVDY